MPDMLGGHFSDDLTSISYCLYKNVKLDTLSHQFGSTEDHTPTEPEGCVLGAVVWVIEHLVKRACTQVPHEWPENKLFFNKSVCPAILCWAHIYKLVAHLDVKGTLGTVCQSFR